MELLKQPIVWGGVIFVGVLAAWLKGFLNQFLPAPQRVWLSIKNLFLTKSPRPEGRFRFVLCWLENDDGGRDTKAVAEAFSGIGGIELVRSARIVAASGAADDWRPAMREGAREVLDGWNADLAIVGLVKQSGEALNLWFVPREGDGTLPRGDQPYELKNATLQEEFREDLRAQLAAEALRAVAPLADTKVRGRVLEKELINATKKLEVLLESGTIIESERRAALSLALGNALAILGEKDSEPERLRRAVGAYTEALKVYTREHMPLDWATTQNNLGNALRTLGERESGPERLEQAVHAYTEALKERTRERVPLDWAMTQNNLGSALRPLGERESGPERLKQAVHAYTEALQVFTPKEMPRHWEIAQDARARALELLRERGVGPGPDDTPDQGIPAALDSHTVRSGRTTGSGR